MTAAEATLTPVFATLEGELNRDCFCIDIEPDRVWSAIEAAGAGLAPIGDLKAARPHLFSSTPVFLSQAQVGAMEDLVAAIETVAATAAFQTAALEWAPPIARADFGTRGVFMGYDFHLTSDGPRLIEINTNAGGAFLNALLAQAQISCCPEVQAVASPGPLNLFDDAVWAMFEAEWRLQGRAGSPRVLAIVDEAPRAQYLYPEFLLAQDFFRRRGVEALIVDPGDLRFADGRLTVGGRAIDLVYNRLVDFDLSQAGNASLRDAYLADAVVVTPNPRHHALLADKRNLTILSDPDRLKALGVDAELRGRLAALPRARLITHESAEELWAGRKSLFFKPAGGHAGKAVYRGDKVTRGVWSKILEGGYIAQAFAAPSERRVRVDGAPQVRKMDVRLYTYAGATLLAAARLYQGQTTNFRTPGGGFAPVVTLDAP